MGCTLNHVIIDTKECEENFSGVGSRIFLFLMSDLADVEDETTHVVTPKWARSETKAEFTPESFKSLQGKLFAIDIKEQSGKVTSESTPNGGGFSNVLAFTVAKAMAAYAFDLRTLNNVKFGAFISDGKGGYYAFVSVFDSCQISNSGDTGDTFDSDHGHTTTITAAPMYYPFMRWCPVVAGSGNTTVPLDLNDWLADSGTEEEEEEDAEP